MTMTNEEKNHVSECLEEAFRGRTIRQEYPECQCGKTFTEKQLYDAPGVFFRDVEVFGKTITLIEPLCPICKRRILASYYVLN
jgi:hypothetical protein